MTDYVHTFASRNRHLLAGKSEYDHKHQTIDGCKRDSGQYKHDVLAFPQVIVRRVNRAVQKGLCMKTQKSKLLLFTSPLQRAVEKRCDFRHRLLCSIQKELILVGKKSTVWLLVFPQVHPRALQTCVNAVF